MVSSCHINHLIWSFIILLGKLALAVRSETDSKENITLLDIINKSSSNNRRVHESGFDNETLSNYRFDDKNILNQLINNLFKFNLAKINEQQIVEFFKNLMENSQVKDFGHQLVTFLGGMKDIDHLFNNPENVANTLIQAFKKLPLDKLANQFGGGSNEFTNQLLSTLKTGQLPSLSETPLNPCNKLMDCSVIEQSYEDFKAIINSIDPDSFTQLLQNPNTLLNNILPLKIAQMISNGVPKTK